MIRKIKSLVDKIFNKKDVLDSLKLLAEYQESKAVSQNREQELLKIARTIKEYPELFESEGFGYLIKFSEYYLNNYKSIDSSELISKIIAKSIIATATENLLNPVELSQEIIQDIAVNKSKSLSKAKSNKAFIITKSISLVINNDIINTERLKKETKKFLGVSENLKEFIKSISEKYSPLLGVLGKDESLESLEHDMSVIIGHGSQRIKGQKSQAERYLELQKFEQEVKSKIMSYIKNNTIGASEQQEYLVNNAIKAAEYLQEDYATGLDRNLKIDEINRRLANIKKIISLIKNGEVATIIGSKIKDQVKDIVDSHPALSRKGPAPEADDF